MNIETLNREYEQAVKTDDFDVHAAFIKRLLSFESAEAVKYHYGLLKERANRDLYLRLRVALTKREPKPEGFLVAQLPIESDPIARADLLHLLGRLRSPVAPQLAREALSSPDPDMRHRGCYVLGWMGDENDIPLLRQALLHDPDPYVRRTAATAHSQMHERLPGARDALLTNLRLALDAEQDEEVIKWIVVTIQYVTKKRFGLREDIEEGVVLGDVRAARDKALNALSRT